MPDIKLRDYQVRGVKQLDKAIKQGFKSICWVFPTGAGKSSVTSYYVKRCVKHQKRVLFFVHSKELVIQFAQRLYSQFDIRSGIIMAGVKSQRHLPVQVASVQTLVRREAPPADIIFIDEAHRAKANTYKKVLDNYPDAIVVGLTATPFRGDGKGLGDIFETIVHPVKIRELIDKKYLVPTKVFSSKETPDMTTVKTVRGDFDQKEMYAQFSDDTVALGVVQNYLKNGNSQKAIVFNINVKHSMEMNQLFNEAGIPSAHLDGATDNVTRARIVKDFANGKYQVLHNVGLFTEGFDIPDAAVCILNRATKSLGLYIQMVGRVLRPVWSEDYSDHIKNEDGTYFKPHGIVLDHGGNTLRHGFAEDYDGVPFSLEGIKKKRKKKDDDEEPKVKICPSCEGVNKPAQKICIHCEEPFPIIRREVTFMDGMKFEALDREATILMRLQKIPLRDVAQKVPASQLRLYSLVKGYKSYWWFHKAIDGNYVKGVSKEHPDAFQIVRTLLEIEETMAETNDLYHKMKNEKKSIKEPSKSIAA